MSIGFGQILIILVVILLLFGPKRLPELAKALGNALNEFKKAKENLKKEANELIEEKAPDAKAGAASKTAAENENS